ncbi:alpha/beta hydrolase [Jeotgalibaca sp. A122]|uniref:alpha/beta hydrolase n=1 Tax=Jeotgalibaca sp. A122 TaxID=3457322 RepID=UPI003FCF40D8
MNYITIPGNPKEYFVLFHGTGGNEFSRLEQAGDIDPHMSVISFLGDVGRGQKRRYFEPLVNGKLPRENIDEKVAEFLTLWDEIKPEDATLTFMGHSNGANFILALLEKRPDIADNVILLHPSNLDFNFTSGSEARIFLTIGARDTLSLPSEGLALSKRLKEVFPQTEHVLLDTGHEITPLEIEKAKVFLGK